MSKHNRERKWMWQAGLTAKQLGRPATHDEIRAARGRPSPSPAPVPAPVTAPIEFESIAVRVMDEWVTIGGPGRAELTVGE